MKNRVKKLRKVLEQIRDFDTYPCGPFFGSYGEDAVRRWIKQIKTEAEEAIRQDDEESKRRIWGKLNKEKINE